jgi:hypothetical protein
MTARESMDVYKRVKKAFLDGMTVVAILVFFCVVVPSCMRS